ncbi:MAG: hypothetical protein ACSHXL_05315 [Bacteroidota bacterium]
MNKFLLISLVVLLGFSMQSCKEDITLSTSYKETPIIFGLLDQSDSIQFIKINRGFIGPGNAFEIAKIPDSSYFENVSAKVEELLNNQVVHTWVLRDTMLDTKSTDGIFFAPQFKAYYFLTDTHPLDPNKSYRLTVDINEGKLTVVGETQLVKDFAPLIGNTGTSLNPTNASLRFAKDPGDYISTSIICDAGTAIFGNVSLSIRISEYRGTDSTHIEIPWNVNEALTANNKLTAVAQGSTFYNKIKDGITNDNSISKRNFEGFTVSFTGGTQELYNYILVNQPSTSLTQSKPTFTNLTVTEGFSVVGIFSARNKVSFYKPFFIGTNANLRCLDNNSTRELCEGVIPGFGASFCSQHPGDNSSSNPKSYACP